VATEADNSGNLKLLIAFVGGGAFVAAIAIALQGMYLNFEWNTDIQRSTVPYTEVLQLKEGQKNELTQYRRLPGEVKDPKVTPQPVIGIPIDEAMKIVIAENASAASKAPEKKAPEKDQKAQPTGKKDVKEHQK